MPRQGGAQIDLLALFKLFPDLFALLADLAKAGRKDSPGGRKFTAAEWMQIGTDAGLVAKDVADALG